MKPTQPSYIFKESKKEEQRKSESEFNRKLYPNQVLIVVEQSPKSKLTNNQKFFKLKLPEHLRIINLLALIRQQLKLSQYDTINLYCNNILLQTDSLLKTLYETHKDPDGFLYINYIEMNSFGSITQH